MAKYYFDFNNTGRDASGSEFAGFDAAWKHATQMSGQMLKDMDGDLRPYQEVRLTVRDDLGKVLFSIYFGADRP